MTTQSDRDRASKKRQHDLGFSKICMMFPEKYRQQLEKYVAKKRREWEKERNAL